MLQTGNVKEFSKSASVDHLLEFAFISHIYDLINDGEGLTICCHPQKPFAPFCLKNSAFVASIEGLNDSLRQRMENFFCPEPGSKCVRLWRAYGFCHN